MYGKVVAAVGGAYVLAFEWSIIPGAAGMLVMVGAGWVVLTDICTDRPRQRIERFLDRAGTYLNQRADAQERKIELRRIAQEELDANCGIHMPEDLKPEDRDWLLEQARRVSRPPE